MARRDVFSCDTCGRDIPDGARVHVKAVTGSSTLPTPDLEKVYHSRSADLCPQDAQRALQEFLDELSYEEAQEWADRWCKERRST
jgi:hypothetical protein